MKKALSKQRNVKFLFCKYPMTIDKRKEWGGDDSNFQNFPNGAFLKVNDDNTISHGVQPNSDFSSPVGWQKNESGTFDKLPIFFDEFTEVLNPGENVTINTLDGTIKYEVTEPSIRVCNTKNGAPDVEDMWIMTLANFHKNYEILPDENRESLYGII